MTDGLLAKLTIIPFDDSNNVQTGSPSGPPFIAQFNPETFALNNVIKYESENVAQGQVGAEAKFNHIDARTFNFELLLDGTGAAGGIRDVLQDIQNFKLTVGFRGVTHRPTFLVLNWGTFLFTCVLESYTVTYKLFRPNGTPLRATIAASFKEHRSNELGALLSNLSSPDIVHSHLVKSGEHLSLIAYRVYKDSQYYIDVARTNNLDNIRKLEVGKTIHLHQLE
jgi:nucleoid-associated protein YgaU